MSTIPEKQKTAVIIGAGPAGLTAALELLHRTHIVPIVLEQYKEIGGISRTVVFDQNRMDIGGHRFFSKSDVVIKWWLDRLPLEATEGETLEISYQHKKMTVPTKVSSVPSDDVMLVRKRKSRIFYDGNFYEYPLVLSFQTLRQLGIIKIIKIGVTYILSLLFPRKENNLEDFFINRFGTELYITFFKTYTEKVWGIPCAQIGADWGRQRVKGLSVGKTILHSFQKLFSKSDLAQKNTETSLIEYFMYPKYGPGHMWQKVAKEVVQGGGSLIHEARVIGLDNKEGQITSVTYADAHGQEHTLQADYVFSTMPINELFAAFSTPPEESVMSVAQNLQFRDFITIGLLFDDPALNKIMDNWIYIHDPKVKVGRIQFFHNWSPHLVSSEDRQLLGLEYFSTENDELWSMSSDELARLAQQELRTLGITQKEALNVHVEKVPKAYPVYTGAYADFDRIVAYLNGITNLYPIGRNGMHRYNNQDHSMLTAMASVESILGEFPKGDVWNINAEDDYHEEK